MDNTHPQPFDYVSVIRRRRWFWITPIVLSILIGAALVRFLPKEFRSTTTLGVTAAQVSPNLIGQATPLDNQERLRAISQQLLSPAILTRVVQEEGLSTGTPTARAIAKLRSAIAISVPDPIATTSEPRRLDTFVVAYSDSEPARTQRIANSLAKAFVETNSKARTEQADDTTAFIAVQQKASEARMMDLEGRLRKAKEAHVGQLPEQSQTNLQMLAGLRQQIAIDTGAIRAERDRVVAIERQIEAFNRNSVDEPGGARLPDDVQSAQTRVAALEQELAGELAVHTDIHPEVMRIKGELASAKKSASAIASPAPADLQSRLARNPSYQGLLAEREIARARIADLEKGNTSTQQMIGVYQSRIEAAPMVEQVLTSIERDYELEKQQYADLSAKQRSAAIAASVQRDRSGEQFAVLESASLPSDPVKPIPSRVMLGALLVGLCLGAALTLGREYFDPSVHNERELRDEVALPILGSITHIA